MDLCNTRTIYGCMRDLGAYGILSAANDLAIAGESSGKMELRMAVPAGMDKSRANAVKNHTSWAVDALKEQGFELEELSFSRQLMTPLLVPALTITSCGTNRRLQTADAVLTARAGQEILQVGWIGLEGMLRVIGEKESELRSRFTSAFIRQMKAYHTEICGVDKVEAAKAEGVSVMRQVSEGGILATLWDLAKDTELGMELELKKMLIRQETIEVCEHFRLNPYQLTSAGCFLMLADKGEEVADALNNRGFAAAVIGQLTGSNDKIIKNGEDTRYIDRPAPDELMKIFL